MPVEIREIVMRARIAEDDTPATQVAEAPDLETLKRQIRDECKARIRQELRRRAER